MKYTLKYYVDGLFKDVPSSQAVSELHDEILSNLEARYDDCIKGGMTPQRAYAAVIGTMGDVSSLIEQVSGTGKHTAGIFEKISPRSKLMQKYSYVFTSDNLKTIRNAAIAIMWLLIVITFFLIAYSGGAEFAWLIFLVGAALTVGINMAASIAKISRNGESRENRIRILKVVHGNVTAIMWLAIVILYFLISFNSYEWDITWLIFIFGAIAQIILTTVFKIQISRFK